jgi:hypothetical protein
MREKYSAKRPYFRTQVRKMAVSQLAVRLLEASDSELIAFDSLLLTITKQFGDKIRKACAAVHIPRDSGLYHRSLRVPVRSHLMRGDRE